MNSRQLSGALSHSVHPRWLERTAPTDCVSVLCLSREAGAHVTTASTQFLEIKVSVKLGGRQCCPHRQQHVCLIPASPFPCSLPHWNTWLGLSPTFPPPCSCKTSSTQQIGFVCFYSQCTPSSNRMKAGTAMLGWVLLLTLHTPQFNSSVSPGRCVGVFIAVIR